MKREPEYLRPHEVAERLQVSIHKVRRWLKQGELAYTQLSPRDVRISRHALDEFLESRRCAAKHESFRIDPLTPSYGTPTSSGPTGSGAPSRSAPPTSTSLTDGLLITPDLEYPKPTEARLLPKKDRS